jgi:hypothetical protein
MSNPNYDNCILGSGIAGLTVFYYLAETTKTRNMLITNNISNETSAKFPLGPRFLRVNKDTEVLLRKLGFSTKTKEVFVGWKHGEEVRNFPSAKAKQDLPNFSVFEVSQVALATSLMKRCLDISEKSSYNSIIVDEIKSINHKKIITGKNEYYSDFFVSTIPLSSLLNVLSSASVLFKMKASIENRAFFLVNEKEKSSFDYIYSSEDFWFRKTYIPELNKWVYEVEPAKIDRFEKTNNNIEDKVIIKSEITTNVNLKELGNNIRLIGRYAQMNNSVRTEDIIHWAHNYTHKFKKE